MPRGDAVGFVHSTFAGAINVDVDGCLVGIVASPLAAGPMSVVLSGPVPQDLREFFTAGESVHVLGDAVCARRAVVSLWHATRIEPLAPRTALRPGQRSCRLALANAHLAALRRGRASVVDDAAANALSRFVAAVVDPCAAMPCGTLDRLIGWGEGLTPACDDFIVGLMAGLASFDVVPAARLDLLSAAVRERVARTTVFSAQSLRLATEGAFCEVLDHARDALFCEPDWTRARAALDAAAAVGATSGVDALSGLVAAFASAAATLASSHRQAA